MHRHRLLLVLTLVVLSLALVGTAAAKPGGPNGRPSNAPPKPRITWSTPRLQQTVSPGQSVQVNVTLTSSVDLNDVTLVVPGDLGLVLSAEPASFSQLQAGVATNVRLTISMPAEGAHNQGGTVQVRAGERAVPHALRVQLRLPRTND
jgi:hypothetical protein